MGPGQEGPGLVQAALRKTIHGGFRLMVISWNTGLAAERARHNLKLKKKKKKGISPQARKRVGPPIKNQGSSGQA